MRMKAKEAEQRILDAGVRAEYNRTQEKIRLKNKYLAELKIARMERFIKEIEEAAAKGAFEYTFWLSYGTDAEAAYVASVGDLLREQGFQTRFSTKANPNSEAGHVDWVLEVSW
jgi:hypothetical protein